MDRKNTLQMTGFRFRRSVMAILGVLSFLFLLCPTFLHAESKTILREEQTVVVDGVRETWRLEWLGKPEPVCQPADDDWYTCPCMGFAYGETGDLRLARIRPGKANEYLLLNPFFRGFDAPAEKAVLQRWRVHEQDSFEDKTLGDKVRKRPSAKIMNPKDYDHDGRATEFVLQIGTEPCGKQRSIVIGLSRDNNKLHAFAEARYPKAPLVLARWEWEKLAEARKTIRIIDWPCGDHGATQEVEFELTAQNGKIYANRNVYACDEDGESKDSQHRRLLRTGPLKPGN